MCHFRLDGEDLRTRFGAAAQGVLEEARTLAEADPAVLVERDGDAVRITDKAGREARSTKSQNDPYMRSSLGFGGRVAGHRLPVVIFSYAHPEGIGVTSIREE